MELLVVLVMYNVGAVILYGVVDNVCLVLQENGAAFDAGGLEVGQLILEVDGHKVEGE